MARYYDIDDLLFTGQVWMPCFLVSSLASSPSLSLRLSASPTNIPQKVPTIFNVSVPEIGRVIGDEVVAPSADADADVDADVDAEVDDGVSCLFSTLTIYSPR